MRASTSRAFRGSKPWSPRRQLKVIAVLEEPTVVNAILTHLGLHAVPLPAVNAQAPPTTVEMFDDP